MVKFNHVLLFSGVVNSYLSRNHPRVGCGSVVVPTPGGGDEGPPQATDHALARQAEGGGQPCRGHEPEAGTAQPRLSRLPTHGPWSRHGRRVALRMPSPVDGHGYRGGCTVPSAGSTTDRGYGHAHQQKRLEYQKVVDAGAAECWRCGVAVKPGDEWHLGHDDDDRSKYRGIECPDCNLPAGGRKGAAITNAKRSMTVREW